MNIHRLPLLLFCCALLLPATLAAQDVPMTVIKTTGTSSVKTQPTTVRFHISKEFMEDTLENALLYANALEEDLRKAMVDFSVQPVSVTINTPRIVSIQDAQVSIYHTLDFNLVGLTLPDEAGHPFGRLCDALLAMSTSLDTTLSDPEFQSNKKNEVEMQAIKEATENAYPTATAIAESLGSVIFAVDTVVLKSTRWHVNEINQILLADLNEMTCTARVEVTYALSN